LRLSQVCIDRPVLATVMSLVIIAFGLVSLTRLPNRELPDVDPPVVAVTTVFPGAAPEVVETSITQVLEDELIGIEGIRHLTSISREQVSAITVEFELSRDVDVAANDVRDRVARARRELPEDVEEPIVAKRDADARAIIWMALFGDRYSQIELSSLAETRIKDRLSKLPGVADAIIAGERRYSMRLWIDNSRLTAHRLTIADVAAALRRENVDLPSGRIESVDQEFTVRTLGELRTAEAYNSLIIATLNGGPVRFRDVGHAEVGPETERKLVRFNGAPAVGIGIVKQSKANTLAVANAVKEELRRLRPELPEGVNLEIAFDSSLFIRRSVEDVTRTIFQAILLVLVVIYLFLRSVRATIIPAISIPVSVIGTFAVLYSFGFSVNTLTLMGITLAIGLVVDDAIVVLENITRWIEQGTPRLEAARRGMEQISFAVVAASVSVIAVFVPLTFLTDTTGRLFREFGVTVASAVAISGFVALTLSPSLCARVLRKGARDRGVKAALARGFESMAAAYTWVLRPTLRHGVIVLLVGALWVGLGFVLLANVDREFVPVADRGTILVFTRAPEGSTIDYTSRYQREVEEIVLGLPEIPKSFSVVALGLSTPGLVNEGVLFSSLLPFEERERSQQQIVEDLREPLSEVTGLRTFPINPATLGQSFRSSPVSLVIQGPDVERLARYADEVVTRAESIPGLVNVQTDLLLNKPQLEVEIDRERASDLGIAVRDIATTLQILLGGLDLSSFKLEGETYDVIAQLERPDRSNPRDLYGLYVRGDASGLIPLRSVAQVKETIAPVGLPHFDRLRSASVTANLSQGASLGAALDSLRALTEDVLPDDGSYRLTFSGESEEFYESSSALLFAYIMAVVIIYLVLAAQFESFLDPVTILVAVALSFTGAMLSLVALDVSLNLFSQIGLVMLVGLVTKNSILIVEFANRLRDRGLPLFEAVLQAARTRYRPILMTAISTIAGILPIALGFGAGGEARAPLGIAVVGGMLFSTALTLVVVPATYLMFEKLRQALRRVPSATAEESAGLAAKT
jgi:multidrug efflux pump